MTDSIQKTTLQEKLAQENPNARPRWGRIIVWGVLILFLAAIGLALMSKQRGPVAVGREAPRFTLTAFSGETYSSDSLRGKVVVINFWASWCKPCEQEAAELQEAWRYYEPGGEVIFLGVDYVDTPAEANAYLDKFEITYPNGPDLEMKISQAFRMTGVPETYVIDQNGKLAYKKIGVFNNVGEIRAAIDPLLTP